MPTGSTLGIPTVDRFEGRRAAAHPLIEMGIPISVAPSCRGWRRRFRCPKRRVSPELELAVAGIPTTEIVQARQDENTCREDLSPLDLIEMGRRIEALEGPKAKERQAAAGPTSGPGAKTSGSGKFPEPLKGEVRDKVDLVASLALGSFRRATVATRGVYRDSDRPTGRSSRYDNQKKVVASGETGIPVSPGTGSRSRNSDVDSGG